MSCRADLRQCRPEMLVILVAVDTEMLRTVFSVLGSGRCWVDEPDRIPGCPPDVQIFIFSGGCLERLAHGGLPRRWCQAARCPPSDAGIRVAGEAVQECGQGSPVVSGLVADRYDSGEPGHGFLAGQVGE
jgi:hypothetical protein